MFNLLEVRKRPEGLAFDQKLEVKDELMKRNPEILDLEAVVAKGKLSYEDGLYLLQYDLSYQLTLPSSRSMQPVLLSEAYPVTELFISESDLSDKKDLVDDELVLVVEGDRISLEESVCDHILLNIPLQVLTSEERQNDTMPSGQSWSVLTETQYQQLQDEKKEAENPFSSLRTLFDQDEK